MTSLSKQNHLKCKNSYIVNTVFNQLITEINQVLYELQARKISLFKYNSKSQILLS